MKQRASTYTLTHEEIVRVFERWAAVADRFGDAAPEAFTAKDQAEYFITVAQIISTEGK